MAEVTDPEETGGLGKDRISAFSDGVFAIAITLLVLDIPIPDPAHTTAAQLPGRLLHLLPQVFSYALSFLIIGVYWVAQHLMLSAVRRADRTLLWINNGLLLCVALVPFSAGLLGQFRYVPLAVAVYGMNLALTGLALEVLWIYITRAQHLTDKPIESWLIRVGHLRTLSAIAINLGAVSLAFVSPAVSVALYWPVPIAYILLQSRDDKRARAANSASDSVSPRRPPSIPAP